MHDARGTIHAPAFVAGATARRPELLRDAQPAHAVRRNGPSRRALHTQRMRWFETCVVVGLRHAPSGASDPISSTSIRP
ncbi:hypothetical protein [Burkholderia cepacia]|uniref:hypothetical protein n=1 Tax=Burkholderia cepacia TaxID=292 RepID=UPI000B04A5A6|nr:hypothetical protein [Burkholderia cepacia]